MLWTTAILVCGGCDDDLEESAAAEYSSGASSKVGVILSFLELDSGSQSNVYVLKEENL